VVLRLNRLDIADDEIEMMSSGVMSLMSMSTVIN
jgi:hypothetical protein